MKRINASSSRSLLLSVALLLICSVPDLALAQAASPFLTGATALQTNILAWLTPVAVILVMVLGAMAMANRMLKSLAARIVFAPKDFPDAREISDELGFTTVRARSISRPLGVPLERKGSHGRSQTLSDQRRALLLPQEVKELGKEEAIVFYEGLRPIRCRKIRYFTDPTFRARLLSAPASAVPKGLSAPPRPPPVTDPVIPTSDPPGPIETLRPEPLEMQMAREATAEDLQHIDSLTLDDFAVKFPKLPEAAAEGRLSEGELAAAVDAFLSSLKGERGETRVR